MKMKMNKETELRLRSDWLIHAMRQLTKSYAAFADHPSHQHCIDLKDAMDAYQSAATANA